VRILRFDSWASSRIVRLALLASSLLLLCLPAFAQGCALCYTQAASSGARMIDALKNGILLLVIPPTLMSIGVIGICYRKRNQFQRSDPNESDSTW
jgi:hypothetical protein